MAELRKRLKKVTPNTRPLQFAKPKQLARLLQLAVQNPNSEDAKTVVKEYQARGMKVPKILQKHGRKTDITKKTNQAIDRLAGVEATKKKQQDARKPDRTVKQVQGPPQRPPRKVVKKDAVDEAARTKPIVDMPRGRQPEKVVKSKKVVKKAAPVHKERKVISQKKKDPVRQADVHGKIPQKTYSVDMPRGTRRKPEQVDEAARTKPIVDMPRGTKPKDKSMIDKAGKFFNPDNWKKTKGKDDLSPDVRTYDTPLGKITLDSKEDVEEEFKDILEMAQKKGGRLRKGKIKTSTRKRAALRGHRAELRGG
tara:strand:- start:245 stop:1171 length:927 start_codon:yes stop_codon:yes gene_type:complete